MNGKTVKRPWITAIGYILVGGFINNCVVEAFFSTRSVDWTEMLVALGILLGTMCVRDVKMRRGKRRDCGCGKRPWITLLGWVIAAGFFINCLIAPYFESVNVINWSGLIAALSTMLGVNATKDIRLTTGKDSEE